MPGRQFTSDRRAVFESLVLPVAPSLYRTARRLCRTPEDAADLLQESLLRAYRTFDGYSEGTNVKAWLFTILYSIVSNTWRRERRMPEHVSTDDLDRRFGESLTADGPTAEHELLARLDASAEVDEALRQLPESFRAVVLLVDVEELSYEEAAVALGCPIGTVRSRLARGRKLLFLALRDYARRMRVSQGDPQ